MKKKGKEKEETKVEYEEKTNKCKTYKWLIFLMGHWVYTYDSMLWGCVPSN